MSAPDLRIGTRGSPLALAQAEEVRRRIAAAHADLAGPDAVEILVISTEGDRVQDRTLRDIGGKGLFTKEIEEALFDGRIDVAVHSMKDVPTVLPGGLSICAMLPREDPRDAWLSRDGQGLDDLPAGARVGTASLRRAAQVRARRPDLVVEPMRGNVGTRIEKLSRGEADATLLALAGLRRLGRASVVTEILAPEILLPAIAQGAIGLECRDDDRSTRDRLRPLDHSPTAIAVQAERALLAGLDGSCRTPIAGLAEWMPKERLRLRGLVAAEDGSLVYADEIEGAAADAAAAAALGRTLAARLRDRAGPGFVVGW